MDVKTYFEKASEFKFKLSQVNRQHKKIKALRNYSEVAPFKHNKYVELLSHCLQYNFLAEVECNFLEYLMTKYQLDYLNWFHKTPWLKRQMKQMAAQQKFKPIEQPELFEVQKFQVPVSVSSLEQINRKPLANRAHA